MNTGDIASTAAAATAVGGVMLGVLKLWVKQIQHDTSQLQHNGGGHVADYAKDARDESRKTNEKIDQLTEKLNDHLIQSAAKHAKVDGAVEVLTALVTNNPK